MLDTIPAYDFLAPKRIVFGWGRWREVGHFVGQPGSRCFVVVGSRSLVASGMIEELENVLRKATVAYVLLANISREPLVEDVDQAAHRLRELGVRQGDVVLGIGGGSAIDLAKAAAAMATVDEPGSVRDYLEGVGRGLTLKNAPLDVIAMPTTAGTGSEATKNAVISSIDPIFKKSLRSDAMMPRVAIIDPKLTVTLPPAVTAQTGMDAITQCVESYLSRKARPIPQALAARGLRIGLGAIVSAVEDGGSRPAREAMAQAALMSGMALANSGLGMAHGVAAALGIHAGVAHGLACAVMLPVALRTNLQIAEERMAELARATGVCNDAKEAAAAAALIDRIEEVSERIGVPRRLSEVGVTSSHIPDLVRDSRGNSMDGNPRSLSDAELHDLLEALL
ncbi:MAG TPA: iron-containing alcohol dehydrogenase [Pirellulales bacterium]|jgi:alcohol dehydrogenase class IV